MAKSTAAETMTKEFQANFQAGFQDNVEKMTSAFSDMNTFAKGNIDALVESMTRAGKGVEEINTHVLAYSKSAMEEGVNTAKKIASVKSVQELIELNTNYAKTAIETHISELSKLSEVCAKTVKESFQPLNDRAAVAMEKVKTQA
jgi:phasin family protein